MTNYGAHEVCGSLFAEKCDKTVEKNVRFIGNCSVPEINT